MKTLILISLLAVSAVASAQTEALKTKVAEVKKKGCPMVNGKEDCSVKEVKEKAIEMKKKLTP